MTFSPTYFVPVKKPFVALTYDDGPVPGVTDHILSCLDKYKAKATFFMVGENVENNPQLARSVLDAGHEIGLHCQHHRKGMKKWSADDLVQDFLIAKSAIQSATGFSPKLIRTPYGNISPSIVEAIARMDMSFVGWSVSICDWLGHLDEKESQLLKLCVPGSIILLHDGNRMTPSKVGGSLQLLDTLITTSDVSFTTVSSLVSMWDDSVVETIGSSHRLLGKNIRTNEMASSRELYLFWHPQDVVEGLSYSVAIGDGQKTVEGHLPVFSSAPDWCKPVIIDPLSDIPDLVLTAHKYNNDTDGFRVNLGCGDHVLKGWDNLDTESRAKGIVKPWQWNVKLPYSDQTVRTVVIQHSLQHCKPKDYDRNFEEIKRVLVPGGKIVVKEADNRYFVWHRPGQTDSDGLIASSTNEPEVLSILERNGFVDLSNDRKVIVDKYGETINRTARLLRNNKLFIVEGTKPKET